MKWPANNNRLIYVLVFGTILTGFAAWSFAALCVGPTLLPDEVGFSDDATDNLEQHFTSTGPSVFAKSHSTFFDSESSLPTSVSNIVNPQAGSIFRLKLIQTIPPTGPPKINIAA